MVIFLRLMADQDHHLEEMEEEEEMMAIFRLVGVDIRDSLTIVIDPHPIKEMDLGSILQSRIEVEVSAEATEDLLLQSEGLSRSMIPCLLIP